MYPRRVFIIMEGRWSMVWPGAYRNQVEMYCRILEGAKDMQGGKAAQVTVVDTVAEAEKRLKEADVVIFISRGVEAEAERIAGENPRVRVVVFTGFIPEGKVIWVDKAHATDRKTIENIVLHSG